MKMKRIGGVAALALAGGLFLIPTKLFAWGYVGHRAIGFLAQERLSPQAASAVAAILGRDDVGLGDIAACADDIKYGKGQSFSCAGAFVVSAGERTSFGTVSLPWKASARWHFVNVPNSSSPNDASIEQYCPPGDPNGNPAKACVMAQIKYDLQILSSPQASLSNRQMALMFLAHLVGDEHQPLHINDNNDWGGNKDKVVFEGWHTNLHSIWDDVLESRYDYYKEPKGSRTADAKALAAKLDSDMKNRDSLDWMDTPDLPDQAAVESFYIAKDVIRPAYAQDYDPAQGVAVFSQAYKERMQPIAYEQLEKAGVRLAVLLNRLFDQGQASSAAPRVAASAPAPAQAFVSAVNFSFLSKPAWDGGN